MKATLVAHVNHLTELLSVGPPAPLS